MRMVNLYMFENLKEKLVGDKSGSVTQGIMVWVSAAIMLVVMVPVINGVLGATPTIFNGTMNTTQSTVTAMVGNSFNLIVVVLIILAAVIILGVIGYLQGGREAA
jgi:choline-glycine betaine transporter